MFLDCKEPVYSGMSAAERGFPVQRPNSTGSVSYVSSCGHSSSSSSSGRGSVSPVGYQLGLSTRVASDPGTFFNPGEHEHDQENIRQKHLGKALIKQNITFAHLLSQFT